MVVLSRLLCWLFNLFFIVLYQNALLVLISLPALIAWQNPTPFTGWDAAFAALFVLFLAGEAASLIGEEEHRVAR